MLCCSGWHSPSGHQVDNCRLGLPSARLLFFNLSLENLKQVILTIAGRALKQSFPQWNGQASTEKSMPQSFENNMRWSRQIMRDHEPPAAKGYNAVGSDCTKQCCGPVRVCALKTLGIKTCKVAA